jgi:3-oxoacyl-[acyl-carrier protein] reductase
MNKNGVSMSLTGQVALVTGGSRGVGAATVKMFIEAGAKVVFSYRERIDQAEAAVHEYGKENCYAVQADLGSRSSGDAIDAARRLVEAAVARFGRLDHLVANHGIWPPEYVPVDEMTNAQWLLTVETNLNSVFGLIKHAVAQMKRQSKPDTLAAGHIVLVSSTAGQRGEAFHCDYAATKGALISMVKGLSTELARDGIYVNCVAPGWVDTEMAAPALVNSESRATVFRAIPLGRVAKPEEIAAPILFLCTPHAGFITGEIFNVNGGAVLAG